LKEAAASNPYPNLKESVQSFTDSLINSSQVLAGVFQRRAKANRGSVRSTPKMKNLAILKQNNSKFDPLFHFNARYG